MKVRMEQNNVSKGRMRKGKGRYLSVNQYDVEPKVDGSGSGRGRGTEPRDLYCTRGARRKRWEDRDAGADLKH